MRALFYTRTERGVKVESDWRETNLAEALQKGAGVHGDELEIRIASSAYPQMDELEPCDLICLCGVKSRYWFRAAEAMGIPWLYFDKGYIRERAPDQWLNYWRLSVNSHHPVRFLELARKDRARADMMEFRFSPWRESRGRHIIVDGGSEKNFKFNRIVPEEATIADVDEHCHRLIARIRELAPERPIIYRPKPSSPGRTPAPNTEFAYKTREGVHKKDVGYDLERAHVVVSYSSAIAYEAHRMGVPSIVLGPGPARPIMSTSLDDLEHPRLASHEERRQWINNLAWCQFTMPEYRNGVAWATSRRCSHVLRCDVVRTAWLEQIR